MLYREIMQLNNSTNLIQAEAYYWKILELMDIAGTICLVGSDLRLTTSRYLTPIVRQSVEFRDMPKVEGKHCCTIREVP